MSFKSVIIYGSTGLCRACIDYLSNQQVKIIGVFTHDKEIISITNTLSIPLLRTDSDVLNLLSDHTDVLLLSIINHYVIPDTILNHCSLLKSINYHDSLLPRYAGVNSTSWAIYNQDSYHGVSWHLIASRVDAGDILLQEQIAIEECESVDSLNLKCTDAAFKLFTQMIDYFDQITPLKQNLDFRTYYARDILPDNFAIISNKIPDVEIERLIRAFSVPSLAVNRLTIPKVKYNDQYWMVNAYHDGYFTLQSLYSNNQLQVHKNETTQVELSSDQLKIVNRVKKYETKNIETILSSFSSQNPPDDLSPDYSSLIRLDRCRFSQEYVIFLIYAAFTKLLDIGDNITVYLPIEDDEIGKLVDKKALLNLDNKRQLTVKAANDLFVTQVSNPIELFKEFDCRYKVSLNTAVGIYIGNPAVLPRHQISITIHKDEIIVDYNQNISNIDVSLTVLSSLINGEIELNPHDSYNSICFLSPEDYTKVIYDWNDTAADYPEHKLIHELFEEQVERTPDNIAVVYEETKLTYRELNNKANLLAHYLRDSYSIKPDDLVTLCFDRSAHMIIAILATLKAGGAYVPLDPSYPDGRIIYILEDTKARVLLTNEVHVERLSTLIKEQQQDKVTPSVKLEILAIDSQEHKQKLATNYPLLLNISAAMTGQTSNHLAYVIYTSGTTGKPKGVMVKHSGLVNLAIMQGSLFGLNNSDSDDKTMLNCLVYANYVFDAFGSELYTSIVFGHSMYLINNDYRTNISSLSGYIKANNISIATIPPVLLEASTILPLKKIVVAGDKTQLNILESYTASGVEVINAYGPTETTVCATLHNYKTGDLNTNIGRSISNTSAYILDSHLSPLPIGVVGELYIGGAGVARGYLNNEELTREKFIVNPFQSDLEKQQSKNACLYKTGDLVRYLADGNIEYIGRNDFQVKIRGYRIELDEIESRLASFHSVKQAVVLALEHSGNTNTDSQTNKYLAGYYVAEHKLDEESIIAYMSEHLPEYMVPNVLVHLEMLPLTINGKLDRKNLPNPKCTNVGNYVAPRNELDEHICEIYAEVLGISKEQFGINDDFFRLGGNSILAIKLVSKLNNLLHCNVRVADIFKAKTVKSLSVLVADTLGNFIYKDYLINTIDSDKFYLPFEMNNVQQAYYLGRFGNFELGNVSTHGYNEHKFTYIDKDRLELAINLLLERHLGLRTIFIDGVQQYLKEYPPYVVKHAELSNEKELLAIRNELYHKIYDTDKFPLFDFIISKCCFAGKEPYYILHQSFDALLMDGNSMIIFFDELTRVYQNQNIVLPTLAVSYRDYQIQTQKIRESEHFTNCKNYWLAKLDNYDFEMHLPLACNPSSIKEPKFNRVSKTISLNKWQAIERKAQQYNIGVTSLVMALYGYVLSKWSNQERLCINLTLFNRLPLHPQINDIIGDFTVLELFNYSAKSTSSIKSLLLANHEELWRDIEHNLFDGIDFQREIRKHKHISSNHIIAPVVLTSVLAGTLNKNYEHAAFIDDSYLGVNYSITQTSQVWLDNKAYDGIDGFVAEWDYVDQLFERRVIEAMHADYCSLIEYLADADWEHDSLPEVNLSDFDQLVIESVNSASQPLYEETLFSYYENNVCLNNPEQLASTSVVDYSKGNAREFRYANLLEDSTLLAKYIYNQQDKLGVRLLNTSSAALKEQQTNLIGVLVEKSYYQVVSALAIMKAGCAYLPLNVDWPIGRIEDVLAQGSCEYVLISKEQSLKDNNLVKLTNLGYKVVIVEDALEQLTTTDFKNNKDSKAEQNQFNKNILTNLELPQVSADDVAYVIFTSGSTGVPKGVTISHRGALNTILAVNDKYEVTSSDCVFALSELSFDLSVYDIFGMLCCGGKIVFPEQARSKEPNYWVDLINQHNVTIWNTVPQLAGLLVDEAHSNYDYIGSLRLFLLSGDWIPLNLPEKIKANANKAQVVSLGGATEGSIWSIWYDVEEINKDWESIPYGRSMPNQKMYVLNHYGQACPIGVIGEIHIGGIGVALNYWGDEEKTLNDYFVHPKLGRIYKTGDLGRWNKAGYIEFNGRKDNQVKVNGYRIELGEISAQLSKLPGVDSSLVTVQDNILVGYLISEHFKAKENSTDDQSVKLEQKELSELNTEDISLEEFIKNKLETYLPEYMIPKFYIKLDKLPLTINGKVDYKQLPSIELNNDDYYVAPRTNLEKQLCQIWQEVLDVEQVGIKDDFFRLGGDSIISIQLVSRLRQTLSLNISVKDIFSHKSVERLYINVIEKQLRIQSNEELDRLMIREKGILSGEVCLLPIQEWFFNKVSSGIYQTPGHCNQSFLVRTAGDIDQEILRLSIAKLIEYHDAFRLIYRKQDNQRVNNSVTKGDNIRYSQEYLCLYDDILGLSDINELASRININYLDLSSDRYQREIALLSSEEQSQYLNNILTSWQDKFVLDYNATQDRIRNQFNNNTNGDESPNLLNKLLFSVGLIEGYADGDSRVYFALHHLLVDDVSWRIIAHDLGKIYGKFAEAKLASLFSTTAESSQLSTLVATPVEDILGTKGTSYRQWVNLVKSYSEDHETELSYWNSYASNDSLSSYNEQLLNMIDSENVQSYGSISFSSEQTKLLLTDANKSYHTEINDLLLCALALALTKSLGLNKHYVTLECHGREELSKYQDISRTVGWFTSMYPVVLPYTNANDLHQTILGIKESIHSIPKKGIGYGALFGYTNKALPRISFNYLGQFDNQATSQANETLWQIVGDNSGISMSMTNHDSNIFNVTGMISNGVLSFEINSKLSQEKLDEFLVNFNVALENVIDYTSTLEKRYYSINDFTNGFDEVFIEIKAHSQDEKELQTNLDNIVSKKIFMLPPGDGGAESYLNTFVPKLNNYDLIVFNNYFKHINEVINNPEEVNNITYEFIAKYYIQHILSIDSIGPYDLFGWSFGGILSLEIAKQLEAMGKVVNSLILLDPIFNYAHVIDNLQIMDLKYINNINYKYSNNHLFANNSKAKIVLFKCNKYDVNVENHVLFKYYTDTESNYLETHLASNVDFELVNISYTHYGCILSDELQNMISIYLDPGSKLKIKLQQQ